MASPPTWKSSSSPSPVGEGPPQGAVSCRSLMKPRDSGCVRTKWAEVRAERERAEKHRIEERMMAVLMNMICLKSVIV